MLQHEILLKIFNKGFDLGGKFICFDFLKTQNIRYKYISFFHSKSDKKKFVEYHEPFIKTSENFNYVKKTFCKRQSAESSK